ncbi:MAG: PAS domain S-box protein [Anaerolineales bacterium]|nr:PAS domain S-box protein [Anaerolineales bacterium]
MYWRQAVLLVIAGLAPWVVNVIYITGLSPDPGLELTPLVLVVTGVIFAWCIFRYRLLDLAPVARETMIETMADGMLVVDEHDRVVDFNPAAQRIVQRSPEIALGQVGAEIFAGWTGCTVLVNDLHERRVEMSSVHGEKRHLELHMSPIRDGHGRNNGRLIVLHDITARKAAQTEIESLNSELEQRVAQRTADYLATIQRLEEEIATRRLVEEQLRQLQGSLVDQLEAQGRKMNALYEIMLHYDNQADPDQVLTQALAKITTMMHADAVCMYEVADNAMVLVTGQGLLPDQQDSLRTLPVGWLAADVPLTSFDLSLDRRLPAALVQSGYGALLAATVKFSEFESGVLQALWLEPRRVTVEDIVSFSVIAEQVALMLENARLRRSHELEAVRIERRRLARDLHDSVTQSLHSLSLLVSALRNRMQHDQRDKVEATLTNLDLTARQALREMRLLLYEMRLAPEDSIRMVETIQTRLQAVESRAGIDATIDVLTPEDWPAAWDAELLPIVMEALNNSLKHASASQVRVQVAGGTDWIELTIQDNGRGFSPGASSHAGMGLQSMCERADRLGGVFEIDAGPGVGARISIRLGTVFHDPDLPAHDRKDTPVAEQQMSVLTT